MQRDAGGGWLYLQHISSYHRMPAVDDSGVHLLRCDDRLLRPPAGRRTGWQRRIQVSVQLPKPMVLAGLFTVPRAVRRARLRQLPGEHDRVRPRQMWSLPERELCCGTMPTPCQPGVQAVRYGLGLLLTRNLGDGRWATVLLHVQEPMDGAGLQHLPGTVWGLGL